MDSIQECKVMRDQLNYCLEHNILSFKLFVDFKKLCLNKQQSKFIINSNNKNKTAKQ
jgi:hypothetical protein